jgi:hypothetical protein
LGSSCGRGAATLPQWDLANADCISPLRPGSTWWSAPLAARDAVLKEINGCTWPERRQIENFQQLKDDGTTACCGWLYCGVYPKEGDNRARARRPDGPDGPGTHLGWAWTWPTNRRNMYNRASADERGRPSSRCAVN